MTFATLIAQDAAPKAADAPMGPLGNPMFLFVIMGLFMLIMVVLPARKQKKEQAAMLANIKKGAKVVTSAGLIGTVVSLKDTEDEMVLRSEDAKLKVTKSSIVRVLGQDDAESK